MLTAMLLVCLLAAAGRAGAGGRVILLVAEGLTEALLATSPTPAMDALAAQGAVASLKPEFPASLVPSLQAMVTGQHGDTTGVIDTEVTDGQGGVLTFDKDAEFWQYAPNITTIADLNRAVAGHQTGCILWPGTEAGAGGCGRIWTPGDYDIVTDVGAANISRVRRAAGEHEGEAGGSEGSTRSPTHAATAAGERDSESFFNKTTDPEWQMWESQISSIVEWFTSKADPVNLVLFNVQQPGGCIATFGPASVEADRAVQKVDQMVASLVQRLTAGDLYADTNIVLTGAHGFVEITADKVVDLSQYIPATLGPGLVTGTSPVLNIRHTDHSDLAIYTNLLKGPADKYDIYIPNNIPEAWHYKAAGRVGEITLVAKEGFAFSDIWKHFQSLNHEHQRPDSLTNTYGLAGYDNTLDSMQSLVILQGPGIARQQGPGRRAAPALDAVDLFPLLGHLLELPELPSNGSLHAVRAVLQHPPSQSIEAIKKVIESYISSGETFPQTVLLLSVSTAAVILLICCCACAMRRRRNNTLGKNHNYKYSAVKHNRRTEGREDGSEANDDKVGLLTSALMEEELEENLPV